jgi:folylpolyglutamate synthase/dihydropteroate synthase
MSVYRLNILGILEEKDFEDMYAYLGIIESDDRLTIYFDKNSSKSEDSVLKILEERNFNVISRAGEPEDNLSLTVFKNS